MKRSVEAETGLSFSLEQGRLFLDCPRDQRRAEVAHCLVHCADYGGLTADLRRIRCLWEQRGDDDEMLLTLPTSH
ncbi:hypothetical protein GEP12_23715 [Salmonella enterica subsp. enterica serovar Anatum]|uniref:hypothetical protein n=1 Tax=Salmonella enterica TaxID=28901 RepID=UPI00142FFA29|nr:hypothetical protein [Salmonella enterica]NJH73411.1 hypothetical protein [Salmonella enterica subsp. enterica serovar Anatum]